MFSYKIFRCGDGILLAIADSNIVGKTFTEKDLEIEVSKNFYHEKICSEKDAIKMAKTSTIVNAVGEKIIDLLLEEKLIQSNRILRIQGVPHAQIICMK